MVDLADGGKANGRVDGATSFTVAPALAPNPLNPLTELSFALATPVRLRISVHDLAGRLLALLADEGFAAGEHSLPWRGTDRMGRSLPSGVYFLRISGDGIEETLRAILVR